MLSYCYSYLNNIRYLFVINNGIKFFFNLSFSRIFFFFFSKKVDPYGVELIKILVINKQSLGSFPAFEFFIFNKNTIKIIIIINTYLLVER